MMGLVLFLLLKKQEYMQEILLQQSEALQNYLRKVCINIQHMLYVNF